MTYHKRRALGADIAQPTVYEQSSSSLLPDPNSMLPVGPAPAQVTSTTLTPMGPPVSTPSEYKATATTTVPSAGPFGIPWLWWGAGAVAVYFLRKKSGGEGMAANRRRRRVKRNGRRRHRRHR